MMAISTKAYCIFLSLFNQSITPFVTPPQQLISNLQSSTQYSCRQRSNLLLQSIHISTHQFIDLCTILKKLKCWHGPNTTLLRYFIHGIDIYFDKDCVWIIIGHFCKVGCYHLTWTAPINCIYSRCRCLIGGGICEFI